MRRASGRAGRHRRVRPADRLDRHPRPGRCATTRPLAPISCSSAAQPRPERCPEAATPRARTRIPVWTKADLALPDPDAVADRAVIATSAVTGAGHRRHFAWPLRKRSEAAKPHEYSLSGTGRSMPRQPGPILRRAPVGRSDAWLRKAETSWLPSTCGSPWMSSASIVGAVVTDDILDRIFRRFCIGK